MFRKYGTLALLGDVQIGKTALMIKYVNDTYDPHYKKTEGVNFMEKTIELDQTDIRFSIYDLGGSKEFENMLPLATQDAISVCFLFDLTRRESLENVKNWWKLVKLSSRNSNAIPVLIGTKYDIFLEMPKEHQSYVHSRSIQFAKSLKSSLIFISTSDSINVQKVFKILISKSFDLKLTIPEFFRIGEPILIHSTATLDSVL
ncbi:hypothetical protein WICMUC_002805 [Wickerhamomyces mucosus]|uniref:Uncharacterized protein n=1 Tax=Wickerhamomyces mucosus TaxID=1378264 RepID=A0A9P8PPV3_9ASCO|nr:hypothetical protein WICMUC_002805 [Wickerhamomyces mucosus]